VEQHSSMCSVASATHLCIVVLCQDLSALLLVALGLTHRYLAGASGR